MKIIIIAYDLLRSFRIDIDLKHNSVKKMKRV